jgi:pyruvate dehydrogenase E2 component (dihydrolipoamide acetyltransferase)
VRKLARDLGIALEGLRGSGPGGLILRDDVLRRAESAAGAAVDAAAAEGIVGTVPGTGAAPQAMQGTDRETRTPIKGMRKHTAAAMVSSAFTAPHVTEFLTVDVTPTMELIGRVRESKAFTGVRITPLTIVAKALCIALRRNPSLNSRWDEPAGEIVQFNYVNLGIAAATPRGLLVPNIKDAQDLGLLELAGALGSLTERARAGKTGPADLSGGTISITNIGVFGIDAGTPILNPGEAAILAMGAVRRMPWEYRGDIALRSVMTLSLSFDHRLVDGEQGSRFLADVGAILADPAMVLTMI